MDNIDMEQYISCTNGQYLYKSKVKPVQSAKRPRLSPYPMLSVSEATEIVLKESTTLKSVTKDYTDCLGYVASFSLRTCASYPLYRVSAKDGYAVQANDQSDIRKVIGSVTPGCKSYFHIVPGTCVRITTGSVVPKRADAVIQVEDTEVEEEDAEGNEIKIRILEPASQNQDIRPVGSDIREGQILIPKYTKISAADIGVLVSCSEKRVSVYDKPRVALLSTGDEILAPFDEMINIRPWCIWDSNKSSLFCALNENRIPVTDAGISKDEADDIKTHLIEAFKVADIVITTGGVSMGEKDIVKQVLKEDFHAVMHFGRVNMKPGKPCTFSTLTFENQKKLVFSLPGNPVSAYVCFHLFVIPSIKSMMGYKEPRHDKIAVKLAVDTTLDERPEFLRVSLQCNDEGVFVAHDTGAQQSSRLLSMQGADALLMLPPMTEDYYTLKAGSMLKAILLKPI